jgi:hypothetical protein
LSEISTGLEVFLLQKQEDGQSPLFRLIVERREKRRRTVTIFGNRRSEENQILVLSFHRLFLFFVNDLIKKKMRFLERKKQTFQSTKYKSLFARDNLFSKSLCRDFSFFFSQVSPLCDASLDGLLKIHSETDDEISESYSQAHCSIISLFRKDQMLWE